MKPRVLFLDHTAKLGGAELYLLDVVTRYAGPAQVLLFEEGPFQERLAQAGVAVDVVQAGSGLRGIARDGSWLQGIGAAPELFHLGQAVIQRAADFDVLFANSQKSMIVGGWAARWTGLPLIWNLHDILDAAHFSSSRRWVAVTVANASVDQVITNSEATRQALLAAGGRADNVSVVYNGIEASRFVHVRSDRVEACRQELGLRSEPVVGLFSRLAPWKGQHVLLDALAPLESVQVLLVGEALFGDEINYERALRAQVDRLGMADRVHFTGFRDDIEHLLLICDVVVHASTSPEPFGRVIVEGLLAGKPVVATRAGGALEIIQDGQTGLLVPPGDSVALSDAIRHLLNYPEHARVIAKQGQAMAKTRFSLDRMSEKIERVLDRVVRKSIEFSVHT